MGDLRWGRVADVHPEDQSVDLVMIDDGSRLAGAQVLVPFASSRSGTSGLIKPDLPASGDKWDLRAATDQDVMAGVVFYGATPVVVGFRFPQICEMLFAELNRFVHRHPSDFYSTTDDAGNHEVYHPSGTYLRIGTSPAHEDLTGKDFDKKWAIRRNTDKAVHVHLRVANAGAEVASVDIDPAGNLSITHAGNFVQNVGGDYVLNVDGSMTVAATQITQDTPQVSTTGNLGVQGAMNVQGEGAAGAVSTFAGSIAITGGDVVADDISLKGHHHDAQGANAPTSEAKP